MTPPGAPGGPVRPHRTHTNDGAGNVRPTAAGTMDAVHYRVLGTTSALRTDGSPVPVGGARLRALLTVLALRPGRTVSPAVLVDEVWGDEPPTDATGALQALVGRLRRALGPAAVASDAGGYRLCADADAVDLYRFERLTEEGTAALADGDATKALGCLEDALALWRGPVLADLPDRTSEAARWEARRLDARRGRLTAALALGRAEQSLAELGALCAAHPLDEPLRALQLRALRDAGRPAEGLAAYEDIRRALAERLGTDPGPELRALYAELLAPAPGRAPARAPDRAYDRVPGAGPDAGTGPGRGTGPVAPHGNLRARLTSFVGREADIDVIREDLSKARLVTLLGPGGAGKTRLSQEAAETVADEAPGGVWIAELAPVDDPEAVPEAVVTALGARETVMRGAGAEELRAVTDRHGDDPVVRIAEHCAQSRMVLILDNCEHVIDAAAALAEQLLQRCPLLTIIATSREPLGVPGELLRPVEPLPEPVALRLLAERGAAARPGFRIDTDAETAAAAAEICRRLDGLPLAIELAAARLRMLSPRGIADRLDDRFRLLTNGSRTVLPRQQTLRAVVDWSWDLLEADERTVLARLSVFAGGCDLAAAEAVCATRPDPGAGPGDGTSAPGSGPADPRASVPGAAERAVPFVDSLDVASLLGSLVDKSLVVAAPSGPDGEMRYRLLETVTEYAGERLDEAGARPDAERAHLTYFRELARTIDPLLRGPGQRAAIDRLEREYENLRTALRRAVAARDEQEALYLVLSLHWFWQIRDLRSDARYWSRTVADLGPDPFAPPVVPAPPLTERCTDRPPPLGPDMLQEARRGVHLVHLACMDMELDRWQTPQAQTKLRGITEAYRPGLPQTCRAPASLWFFAVLLSGDFDRVREIIDATVRVSRESGYTWELASALQMRANLLANRSDWSGDAGRDADESLSLFVQAGDLWGTAEALSARGEARERSGQFTLAAEDFAAAVEYAERLGAPGQVALLGARHAGVLVESGDLARGESMLRDILENGRNVGNEAGPFARMFLALLLGSTDRVDEARDQLTRLRQEFGAVGFVVFDGVLLGMEAWLDAKDGRYEEGIIAARAALDRSVAPLSQMMAPHMASVNLTTGALLVVGMDDGRRAQDAARLLGAADALLPSGHRPTWSERQIRAEAETRTRSVLGEAEYEATHAAGGALTLDEAVTLLETDHTP